MTRLAVTLFLVSALAYGQEARLPNGWWIEEELDAFTDILTTTYRLPDAEWMFVDRRPLVYLMLQCEGGELSLAWIWLNSVISASPEPKLIQYRVDENPIIEVEVSAAANFIALTDDRELLAEMLSGQLLRVRATAWQDGANVDARFDLSDLRATVNACPIP